MIVNVVKQVDQVKRLVEKSRTDEAVEAYPSVKSAFPNHIESIQSMGAMFAMHDRLDRVAIYYGMLIDG